MKKTLTKTICLILTLILVLGLTWHTFNIKVETTWMTNFYKQEKNSIDALFVGSSHVYMNVNPNVLWEEYGISSFDLCGPTQPIWNSYYYIEEALKYQNPKVVVLDCYTVVRQTDYSEKPSDRFKNFWSMRPSRNKLSAIKASLPEEQWLEYALMFPVFHSRYTDLNEDDFEFSTIDDKGFWPVMGRNEIAEPDMEEVSNVEARGLTPKNIEYLRAAIETCQNHNVDLILTIMPYQANGFDESLFKSVQAIADEYGVPFYNLNYCYDEIGIDFSKDYFDTAHMNYLGTEKLAKYLAENVLSEFALEDHRGDSNYKSYDEALERYNQVRVDGTIANSDNFEEKLLNANSKNLALIVSTYGDISSADNYGELEKNFNKLGINIENTSTASAYVMVDGGLVYSTTGEDYLWHKDISKDVVLTVESTEGVTNNWEDRIYPKVYINKQEYFTKQFEGVRLTVYDTLNDVLVADVEYQLRDGHIGF